MQSVKAILCELGFEEFFDMTGSIKWMNYTSDNGTLYAVKIDESNGEAGGFLDVTGTADGGILPRGAQMRYVNAISADGIQRRFWIGAPDNALYTDGGSIVSGGVTFNVSSRRGEQFPIVRAADTGQTDGDAT